MSWTVKFAKKAAKQSRDLPKNIQDILKTLIVDIQLNGPVRGNWSNYSKLNPGEHHCHLTYRFVACWRVTDKTVELIEVYYVGTRENAPY